MTIFQANIRTLLCVIVLRDRIVCWIERGALLLLFLYLGLHTLPRAWEKLNTDFPNYYLAARLAREGYDTSRMYEWRWLQREKDHRQIDVPVIGLLPITPISTLPMWLLARLSPLQAKHVWITFNLALLFPLCWLLRSLTGLTYQRVALVFALSFPLHRNLLYGQFYLVLLLMIAGACWAYLRKRPALAGVLIGLAAASKIFPVVFFVFFLTRRAWRALIAGLLTVAAACALSVAVFGWSAHRTYLLEILPWTLHGEGLPPYDVASQSISSALHFLFLSEPQWNPHPWHSFPLWYAALQALLPCLITAPAILLMRRGDERPRQVLLEWSALLVAALAVSTIPASYNFVLLVFPVCVLAAIFIEKKRHGLLVALGLVYVGIGFPLPVVGHVHGPAILLGLTRLPLLLVLLSGIYIQLRLKQRGVSRFDGDWLPYAVAAGMMIAAVSNVPSTYRRELAVREEFRYRLPMSQQALLATDPKQVNDRVMSIDFTPTGYYLEASVHAPKQVGRAAGDDLSFSQNAGEMWVERSRDGRSNIVEMSNPDRVVFAFGEQPMPAADGSSMAFISGDRGRSMLIVRQLFSATTQPEKILSPGSLNVYEASFLSSHQYVFSAATAGGVPAIYLTDGTHHNELLQLGEARYPAFSPDGRWLAYSRFEHGVWNLWLRDEKSGATRRIADVPCNQTETSWESDSKTLLYGTDCGRSLWFNAIARRRVIP